MRLVRVVADSVVYRCEVCGGAGVRLPRCDAHTRAGTRCRRVDQAVLHDVLRPRRRRDGDRPVADRVDWRDLQVRPVINAQRIAPSRRGIDDSSPGGPLRPLRLLRGHQCVMATLYEERPAAARRARSLWSRGPGVSARRKNSRILLAGSGSCMGARSRLGLRRRRRHWSLLCKRNRMVSPEQPRRGHRHHQGSSTGTSTTSGRFPAAGTSTASGGEDFHALALPRLRQRRRPRRDEPLAPRQSCRSRVLLPDSASWRSP